MSPCDTEFDETEDQTAADTTLSHQPIVIRLYRINQQVVQPTTAGRCPQRHKVIAMQV